MDAGQRGAGPGARARVPLRLLLRPARRRPHPPEAVRGPDARPHHPQGRPHRHRDHEPADRAGAGARASIARAGGAPRGGAAPATTRGASAARCCSTSARGALRGRARPGDAPRDGRRADDVPRLRLLGRQGLRRPRAGVRARALRAPRHGDDPVPSDRADRARTRS